MTPLEKAVEAYDNATLGTAETHVRRIITAFLETAATDKDLCREVFVEAMKPENCSHRLAGQAAILALKEAVG